MGNLYGSEGTETLFRLIDDFDVWGNEKDGFEVNDSRIVGDLYISDNATEKDIVRQLKEIGYLGTDDLRKLNVSDCGDSIEITLKNGYPICYLQMLG